MYSQHSPRGSVCLATGSFPAFVLSPCCQCYTWRLFCPRELIGRRKLWIVLICQYLTRSLRENKNKSLFPGEQTDPHTDGILSGFCQNSRLEVAVVGRMFVSHARGPGTIPSPAQTRHDGACQHFWCGGKRIRSSELISGTQTVNSMSTWTRDLAASPIQPERIQEAPLEYL